MVVGNLSGGKISDKAGPGHMGRYGVMTMFLMLGTIFFFSDSSIISVACMVITTAALFSVSAPQQLLLLRYSDGGELLGGAMVQIAFNLGNAIGAFSGGVPISLGMTYNYCALVGLCFVAMALVASFINIIRCKPSKKSELRSNTIFVVCGMPTYWYFLCARNVVILHSEINKKIITTTN